MTETFNNGLGKLSETLQSDKFKKILPYLLAGGGGAVAGAYMTGGRKPRKESRMGYLGRVLRNSLATGGLAAGGLAAARYGADKISTPSAANGKQAPDLSNPTDQALRSTLFSPLAAAAAGGTGLALTHALPGVGANTAPRDQMREAIAKAVGYGSKDKKGKLTPNVSALMGASPDQLGAKLNGINDIDGLGTDKAVRMAGLTAGKGVAKASLTNLDLLGTLKRMATSPSSIKSEAQQMGARFGASDLGDAAKNIGKKPTSILQELKHLAGKPGARYHGEQLRQTGSKLSRRGLSTLGQSTGRRAFRGGLGLAAASIPALVGAFATDPKEEN